MLETDEKGRIKLSMKALLERPEGMEDERPRREYGDRPRRDDRERGDRPPRRDRGDRGERAERAPEGGDAPATAGTDTGSANE